MPVRYNTTNCGVEVNLNLSDTVSTLKTLDCRFQKDGLLFTVEPESVGSVKCEGIYTHMMNCVGITAPCNAWSATPPVLRNTKAVE